MPDFIRFNFPKTPAPDWGAGYIGIGWLWRGRILKSGIDCFGLLADAYHRHFGVVVFDMAEQQTAESEVGQARQTSRLLQSGMKHWTEVKYPADGVSVLMRRAGHPIHVGMCYGNDILHCDQGQGGVVRERRSDLAHDILGYFVPTSVVIK